MDLVYADWNPSRHLTSLRDTSSADRGLWYVRCTCNWHSKSYGAKEAALLHGQLHRNGFRVGSPSEVLTSLSVAAYRG